jgi:hypothetical protein
MQSRGVDGPLRSLQALTIFFLLHSTRRIQLVKTLSKRRERLLRLGQRMVVKRAQSHAIATTIEAHTYLLFVLINTLSIHFRSNISLFSRATERLPHATATSSRARTFCRSFFVFSSGFQTSPSFSTKSLNRPTLMGPGSAMRAFLPPLKPCLMGTGPGKTHRRPISCSIALYQNI